MSTAVLFIKYKIDCGESEPVCSPSNCVGGYCYNGKCYKTSSDYIRWQRSDDSGVTWYDIPLNTINHKLYNFTQTGELFYFTVGPLTVAKYRARITNPCGDSQYSEVREVSI